MSVFHENMLIGSSGQGAPVAAGIPRSLRFNSSDSAYLSRTPASAGNRKTWTWAGWVKRSNLTDQQAFWSAGSTGTNRTSVLFDGSAKIRFFNYAGSVDVDLVTTPVYRDASAWYHFVIAVDTTQGTASNRIKLYVNGVEVTAFSTSTYPSSSQDLVFNSAIAHGIGRGEQSGGEYFSGYLADVYFIDGQALTPSSFTETDATTGQLVEKAYTGSYGTNGFHLEFADNSSNTATTLGKDTSGNSPANNWTPNNLSVTAGAGNDSLVDVPTNGAQTDTGVGGEVRGNYCTLNPLYAGGIIASTVVRTQTVSDGNLYAAATSNSGITGTLAASSGKWYYEVTVVNSPLGDAMGLGFYNNATKQEAIYRSNAQFRFAGVETSYGATYVTGDVMGIALNIDSTSITFYKNGVSQGVAKSDLPAGDWIPFIYTRASFSDTRCYANFGQRPFAYTAPSGFKALCTANLPAPLVTKPNTVMDVKLYTGNGSTQTISGLGFSPDFVWIKARSSAQTHSLTDVVRGTSKQLFSNLTNAEGSETDQITAFNSDGFSLGANVAGTGGVNTSSVTYAAWTWDAGSSTVTNTQGSITSSVRANATAGFSVVTFTGTAANATVGHGLNVAPELIILKDRDASSIWPVYCKYLTSAAYYLQLQSTAAQTSNSTLWNSTAPTSTVFSVGSWPINGNKHVAYCFAPVVGYSSFGSYTGNGSTDGPFVYTGFRPAFVMLKESSASGNGWEIRDSMREPYNDSNRTILLPNLSNAEITDAYPIDFTSNGFKVRNAGGGSNNSGATYIYAAFAESPFNYARAR